MLDLRIPAGAMSPGALEGWLERLSVAPAMADRRPLPRLYEAGIVYRREPVSGGSRRERWQTPWETLRIGHGDCEDLAIYRTVELRRQGEIGAKAAVIRQNKALFHAVVRRADGTIEDPSKILMEQEMQPNKPVVSVLEHSPGKWVATVGWRGKSYEVTVRALGDSTVAAAERATALAKQIATNPVMKALLPPQAAAAIRVGGALAKIARRGGVPALRAAFGKLRGPGARRLAKVLGGS